MGGKPLKLGSIKKNVNFVKFKEIAVITVEFKKMIGKSIKMKEMAGEIIKFEKIVKHNSKFRSLSNQVTLIMS